MAYSLFIDTNVYLDLLLKRGNWQNARDIFKLAEVNEISVYTSSSSLVNVMYVLKANKIAHEEITTAILDILTFTNIANPDYNTFEYALLSKFRDAEDAVQYFTALEINKIDYFVTGNIKDFKAGIALLPVVTSSEFMNIYRLQ